MKLYIQTNNQNMEKNILQKIPNRIAGDCVAVRIRILNRVITGIYDEFLRPLVSAPVR